MDQGAIKPLCDLLSTPDVRIVTVALEGLENILKVSLRLCGQWARWCLLVIEFDTHASLVFFFQSAYAC